MDESVTTTTTATLRERIKQLDTSRVGLFLCILLTVVQILLFLRQSLNDSCELLNSDVINSSVICSANTVKTVNRLEALSRELYTLDDRVFVLEKRIDSL